ncbi:MAG: nuclear transport factor 2 family protein [Flavobacterium sp. JAD_PAG50586_2]|nr:MAG: nuclear transport factor 2 family protein [Flavobacterium sp. JAD_PAG50586_2]
MDFLDQLKKFKADYLKGILDENPEIIQGYLADDFRLMPEFQKTIKNKQNSLLYFKLFADRFDTQSLSRSEIEVLDLGTRIVEIGTFSTKIKSKTQDKYYELKGKYVDLWEKKESKSSYSLSHGIMTILWISLNSYNLRRFRRQL